MNKLLTALSILCAGALGTAALHRTSERTAAERSALIRNNDLIANQMTELRQQGTALADQVRDKKAALVKVSSQPHVAQELLDVMEGKSDAATEATWSDLRKELALGWNNSSEYVLVRKETIAKINVPSIDSTGKVTPAAKDILAISPAESSLIVAAVKQAQDWTLDRTERAEPVGDIVAGYRIQADPALEHAISNTFRANITGTLGPERSDLFFEGSWRKLRTGVPSVGQEPVTLIVRRTGEGPDSKLIWETRQGTSVSSAEVRYGHYPSLWFLKLFPGGWRDFADRSGFELPRNFGK